VLERLGEPGPFEALLRTAVVSGERSRMMPTTPSPSPRHSARPLAQPVRVQAPIALADNKAAGRHVLAEV